MGCGVQESVAENFAATVVQSHSWLSKPTIRRPALPAASRRWDGAGAVGGQGSRL
jgi:hypothetical protein